MVAVLVRIFGLSKFDQIEDAVQDALIAAMKKWPFTGVPANPTAWLIQTAKNRMIDVFRRESRSEVIDETFQFETPPDETRYENELREDQLRMIFACCDPTIPADSQVALTLKTISGFSVPEIARAYLANDEAVAKMVTRAKAKLRENVVLEIPSGDQLKARLDAVLRVLYLMFNEGYSASGGDELLRRDLCEEAIRLSRLLLAHPLTNSPKVYALQALFLFQASRIATRMSGDGRLVLLADQDRSKWNSVILMQALDTFRRSAAGDELSSYHLEAEIASLHALAPTYAATDWTRMLVAYDGLLSLHFSPVVSLNRAVVIGELFGSQAALDEITKLSDHYLMTRYDLYHSTKAHFLAKAGCVAEARHSFLRAMDLTNNTALKTFFEEKISELDIQK